MLRSVGSILRQFNVAAILLLGSLVISGTVLAQGDPRSNVNLIGMTPDPADIPDTHYRQQNEPACAIRPGDSACMICAYNDYRGVELFGDSWQGVSQSCTAGDSWRSRLAPGHPLHPAPIAAEFAADPRIVAIPGVAIFNFIAGFRDSNVGVLAIQHWLEVNKEDADHYEPGMQTYIADTGTEGRFLDKPDMVAVLDAPNRQRIVTLSTEMENTALGVDGIITRDFPSGTLYVAYAVFTGSNSTKVLLKTSDDWGRTWRNQAMKLSEDQNEVSGISLTAIGDNVVAVWRRKGDGNDVDSIMYSLVSNGGKKATKGEVLADLCAFDQPTLTGTETDPPLVMFRTNDFPWTANDGENFYAFYSDRGRNADGSCDVNGQPRIVMHHTSDGLNWTDDGPINSSPKTDDGVDAPNSFQFMPTAFGADGKVQVAWYDTRREECAGSFPYVADYNGTCGVTSTLVQRTVDVYTTTVTADTLGAIPDPVRASQFSIVVDRDTETEYETEASYPNKKLFAQGNAPFLGDYIAIAAREFRQDDSGAWISNASASDLRNEDFFVAWTDNRDVRGVINSISEPMPFTFPPAASGSSAAVDSEQQSEDTAEPQLLADGQPVPESGPPRDTTKTAEGIDGSDPGAMACTPGQPATFERSRDSNIYGSLIKDQLRMYAPSPSKPLSGLQRAFVVALSNSDVIDHTYDLEIDPGNCNGTTCTASFRQQPSVPHTSPLLSEQLTVPAKSTLARTVFVSGTLLGTVKVNAQEGGDLVSTIELGNTAMLDPENCADPTKCSVAAHELHNLELKTVNASLLNALMGADQLNASLLNSPLLVDWAVENGCCDGEDPATAGSVIEFAARTLLDPDAIDVPGATETNASLLNKAMLSASLLNASLLNASLLNTALDNASLLNMSLDDSAAPDLDAELVQAATDGGAEPTDVDGNPTVGAVILFAANPENNVAAALLNASLLNASLLNASLLNASLLNASLLNASLLNASLLSASLLNATLLNASLLNPDVEAASLLNASLLNADLLNASLLNPTLVALATEGGCCDDEETPTVGSILIYAVGHPETINASLLNASLLNASLLNASLLNASLLNASLLNASLLNANFADADSSNASLLNASLLNADLQNANFLNASLLNTGVYDAVSETARVTYDDYTYPITNNGNVTTAIDVDITINAPTIEVDGVQVLDVIGVKLMTWTANATPTVIDCVERVQLDTRVQSISGIDATLEVATIDDPFVGQLSVVVVAGETAFATMRVTGTTEQLKNVRVSGFTASSQAANCTLADGCDDQLNEGVEQIVFKDAIPPTLHLPGPILAQATSAAGASVSYTVTATDNVDVNPSIACFPESGNTFPLGVTTVECSAWDSVNNGVSGEFTITVEDTTPPTLVDVPGNIIKEATSALGAVANWTDPTSADNGGTATVSCAPASGSTFALGTNEVTCTADDGRGNTASESFTVAVVDTTVPVLVGMPGNLTTEATSASGAVASWVDPTATDNGGTATVICIPASGSVFALGENGVTCTADDGRGSTASESFTVTVVDTTVPVLVGMPGNITEEALSGAGAVASWPDPTATDNGGTATVSCAPASGSMFALGTNEVTCTADDGRGNTASGSFTVSVVDTTVPILVGVPGDITTEATGNTGAVAIWTDPTATDNGGSATVTCLPVSGSLFALGTSPVTCTADDGRGNSASVSFGVAVQDTTAPTLPTYGDQTVQATSTDGTPVTWSEVAEDIVDGAVVVSCSPASGFAFPIGVMTVNCSADDAALNHASAAFNVTVEDTVVPVVSTVHPPLGFYPGAPYPFELEADATTITVVWPVSVTDSDPDLSISCSIDGAELELNSPLTLNDDLITATFSYDFPVGDTTVTCAATDSANGTSDPVSFTVNVLDVTPPDAPDVSNVDFSAVEATGPDGATVTWIPIYANDTVSGTIEASCTVAGSTDPIGATATFPVGTTIVSCTAQDEAAPPNVSDASTFDVTVVDTTAPTLTNIPASAVVVVAGDDGVAVYDLASGIGASDAVDATPLINCSTDSLLFGMHTVTCTATDVAGNSSSATYALNVTDNTGPIITLNGPSSLTLEAGIESYSEAGATANDNVDGDVSSRIIVSGSVNTSTVGTYTISYNATDTHGNAAATVLRNVIVADTIAPVISAPAETEPHIVTTATSPAAVDFTGLVSVADAGYPATAAVCTPASGSNFDWGDTTVTCDATDGSGNAAVSASFIVRVRYLYDIELFPPKGSAKAGSTVPLDWQYLSWTTGMPIASATVPVSVRYAETVDCSTPKPGGLAGDDSGSSDFRYSESDMRWQYSWQTPGAKGKYLVTISPPGSSVNANASACVTLR